MVPARRKRRIQLTGVMSTISFQSGLFRERAYMSHSALSTAPSAMWMTPFSGPILRTKSTSSANNRGARAKQRGQHMRSRSVAAWHGISTWSGGSPNRRSEPQLLICTSGRDAVRQNGLKGPRIVAESVLR